MSPLVPELPPLAIMFLSFCSSGSEASDTPSGVCCRLFISLRDGPLHSQLPHLADSSSRDQTKSLLPTTSKPSPELCSVEVQTRILASAQEDRHLQTLKPVLTGPKPALDWARALVSPCAARVACSSLSCPFLGSPRDDYYAAEYQSDSRVSAGTEFCL